MSKRYITLYPGRHVSLGAYVQGWKKAKTLPLDTICKDGPGSWAMTDVGDTLRKLRLGMHDRINKHIAGYGVGRKWRYDWQIAAWRDSRKLQDIRRLRLRVYRFETSEANARFSHLLASHDDY